MAPPTRHINNLCHDLLLPGREATTISCKVTFRWIRNLKHYKKCTFQLHFTKNEHFMDLENTLKCSAFTSVL